MTMVLSPSIKFSDRQLAFMDFVAEKHRDQKRKYTGEPYFNHLVAVAKTVAALDNNKPLVEIALGHDLFEDTNCTEVELQTALYRAGYSGKDIIDVTLGVNELTDVYTSATFPLLNRQQRKILETKRLSGISSESQTVKVADIIDNSSSIMEHDPYGFGKVYLNEIKELFTVLTKADPLLRQRCQALLDTF